METIDWTQAPAGFPLRLFIPPCPPSPTVFRKRWVAESADGYRSPQGEFWSKAAEAEGLIAVARPPAPEWDGRGLPPVGTECEAYWWAGEYVPARIVGHDEDRAVFRLLEGSQKGAYGACLAGHPRDPAFRPMRSPEQKAREAHVEEMMRRFALHGRPDVDWRGLFEQMYDAGLRFPAGVRT